MKQLLSLTVGGKEIEAPSSQVPQGGLDMGEKIIQNSITILLVATVVFSLIMFIWGGITWITSNGDKAKIQAARNRLLYAIIGLVVAFFSFSIIGLISYLFSLDLLTLGS